MIDELDEYLKKFLTRELATLGYDPGKVDIVFDQPKREWSARVSRPTLNLFLYDIRENQKLRQTQPSWETIKTENGRAEQRRKPVRMDLHYLITAWGTIPEDEHVLLSRAMMALLRYPNLPDIEKELPLPESLKAGGKSIPVIVAQYEELSNPTDIWNVIDNELRPSITCVLTVGFDPFAPVSVPLVRSRELIVGESPEPSSGMLRERAQARPQSTEESQRLKAMNAFRQDAGLLEEPIADRFWTIGGHLLSSRPVEFHKLHLLLVEQGVVVPVQPDGRFVIGRLKAGQYALELTMDSGPPRRFAIHVPSADFELEI